MTDVQQSPLGIGGARRVLGVALVLAMYGIGIAACYGIPQHTAKPLSRTEIRGLIVLIGAVYGTPYILIPCVLDRFPKWIVQASSVKQLRQMAKWFFGVRC